jgi:cobalamin biosynthesis protein CobT
MLSRDHGITLRCEGEQAYAQRAKKLVVLPALPDAGIVDGPLLRNIRFFLDHEVGHLVGESSDEVHDRIKAKWGDQGFAVMNALEDVRVEALMSKVWAGCKINLDSGRKPLLDKIEKQVRMRTRDTGEKLHPCRQVVMAIYRRGAGMKSLGLDYMDDDLIRRAIGDAGTDPHRIKSIASWAESTEDLEPVAEAILTEIAEKIKEDQGEQPQPQPQPSKGGEGEGEAQGQAQGSDGADGEGDGDADAGQGDATEGDGKDGQPQQGGGGKPTDGDGEAGEGSSGEGQPPQPRDAGDPDDAQGDPASGAGAMTARSLIDNVPDAADGMDLDIGGHAAAEIDHTPAAGQTGDLPGGSTRTAPVDLERIRRGRAHSSLPVEKLRYAAQCSGGANRQRLVQMLQCEDRVWWQGGRDRGAPDPSRLAALASGTSNRVMRRRQFHAAKTTAVSLLLDGSGSMHSGHRLVQLDGKPIAVAAQVAAGLLQACSLGGIRTECLAFTGGHIAAGAIEPELALIQRFGQRFDGRVLDNLAHYTALGGGGTPLAASLWVTGHRLLAQRAPRKVLIANTDGGAGDAEQMEPTIKYLEARGVEVVLIGIMCDAVRMYHDKHAVVYDLADLGRVTMRELAKHLHVGQHAA